MPGFDGNGPRHTGPMSGGGAGYCVLRLEEGSDMSLKGVAGLDAHAVGGQTDGEAFRSVLERRAAALRRRLAWIESRLQQLRGLERSAHVGRTEYMETDD